MTRGFVPLPRRHRPRPLQGTPHADATGGFVISPTAPAPTPGATASHPAPASGVAGEAQGEHGEEVDEFAAHVAATPGLHAAGKFNRDFGPIPDVDYEWVCDLAEKKFDLATDTYRNLDDKAGAVVTYLGGVTSLVAAGVVTAAATARLNGWVVAAFFPAFAAAAAAVVNAARARDPRAIYHPPRIDVMVRDAHHAAAHGMKNTRAISLGRWHVAVEGMYLAIAEKGQLVSNATWAMAWAVVLLGLPLLTVIVRLATGLPIVYPPTAP